MVIVCYYVSTNKRKRTIVFMKENDGVQHVFKSDLDVDSTWNLMKYGSPANEYLDMIVRRDSFEHLGAALDGY